MHSAIGNSGGSVGNQKGGKEKCGHEAGPVAGGHRPGFCGRGLWHRFSPIQTPAAPGVIRACQPPAGSNRSGDGGSLAKDRHGGIFVEPQGRWHRIPGSMPGRAWQSAALR